MLFWIPWVLRLVIWVTVAFLAVCSVFSDICYQHDIFSKRTAARWIVSLFWTHSAFVGKQKIISVSEILSLCGTINHSHLNHICPFSDAQFELQQVIVTMSTCLNTRSWCWLCDWLLRYLQVFPRKWAVIRVCFIYSCLKFWVWPYSLLWHLSKKLPWPS